MHTDHKREDPQVDLGYEIRDINYPAIKKAVIFFFAFAIGSAVFTWFFLFGMPIIGWEGINPGYAAADSGYQAVRVVPQSPNPVLQTSVTAKTDIHTLRQQDEDRLTGTGYTDATRTRAFIPIDQAMDLVVERGVRTGASVNAQSKGNTDSEMHIDNSQSADEAMRRMRQNELESAAKLKMSEASAAH